MTRPPFSVTVLDWSKLDLRLFVKTATPATSLVFLPGDTELHELALTKENGVFKLNNDPLAGKVSWNVQAE